MSLKREHRSITLSELERDFKDCGIDRDEFAAKSHRTIEELLEAVNTRDILFEKRNHLGTLILVQSSLKARVNLFTDTERLCEFMRLYHNSRKIDPTEWKFCTYAGSETVKLGETQIAGAVRCLREEFHIETTEEELDRHRREKQRAGAHQDMASQPELRLSTVYYRIWSETISQDFDVPLPAIPAHEPFGSKIVRVPDGSVECHSRWLTAREMQQFEAARLLRSLSKE